MLAGVVGHVAGVPHPLSGASIADNSDSEIRELLSGGRSSWRAPITYQTLSLSWRSTRESLKHLRDLYNRRWGGPGHFWIVPPNAEEDGNLLPMRWSVGTQLAHALNGLGRAYVIESSGASVLYGGPEWNNAQTQGLLPRMQIIVEPGNEYYFGGILSSNGLSASQGVIVDGHKTSSDSNTWTRLLTLRSSTTAGQPVLTKAQSLDYDFLRISFAMPASTVASLTISSIELSKIDYMTSEDRAIRPGTGLGAVQLTSQLDGSILSNKINRVSYSADFTEVEL